MSTAAAAGGRWWTDTELAHAAARWGIAEWPSMLGPSVTDSAVDGAGVLGDARHDDETNWSEPTGELYVLARPDVRVEMRIITTAQEVPMRRVLIAARDEATVLAECEQSRFWIEPVASIPAAAERILGAGTAARCDEFRCPTDELVEVLQLCSREHELVQGLGMLGASGSVARGIARVLAGAQTVTEVVVASGADRARTTPPIAVYDTPGHGRLLITGRDSSVGVPWSTLSPATTKRITLAVLAAVTTSCLTRGGEEGE